MTQKSVSFNDFAVPTVRRNDYRINFWFTTENKVLYRGKNTDLNEKTGDYEKNKYLFQWWKMIHHTVWLNNIGIMEKNKKKEKNLKSTIKIIKNAVKNKPRSIQRFIWGTEK